MKNLIRILKLRKHGHISLNNKIDSNTIFDGKINVLGVNNVFISSYLGHMSYVGSNNFFNRVKIGKFCSIGNGVKIVVGNHLVDKYVSTSPVFYLKNDN